MNEVVRITEDLKRSGERLLAGPCLQIGPITLLRYNVEPDLFRCYEGGTEVATFTRAELLALLDPAPSGDTPGSAA